MNTINEEREDKIDHTVKPVHVIVRLVNFIVDTLVWLILYFTIAYFLDQYIVRFNSFLVNYVYSICLGLLTYLAYYMVMEFYFHKTLGKFITRTKVVSIDATKVSLKSIIKRSLSRLIPIDALYYIFSHNGLHDNLSRTKLIKDSKQ